MIKVCIVDDHALVIEGLQLLLESNTEIEVVATANSAEALFAMIWEEIPDVFLLDINLPGKNGIETCAALLKQFPETKVIAITSHKESSLIKLMLQKGALGYVLKNTGSTELVTAIKTVHKGEVYVDPIANKILIDTISNRQTNRKKEASPFPKFSRREKEVLQLILAEYTTAEIAGKLNIGFGTVETHRRNMLVKTGARNTAGLVRISLEYELHK